MKIQPYMDPQDDIGLCILHYKIVFSSLFGLRNDKILADR